MTELEQLWEDVAFFARHRRLNAADYEIYKGKLAKLVKEGEYEVAGQRLVEVMGLGCAW